MNGSVKNIAWVSVWVIGSPSLPYILHPLKYCYLQQAVSLQILLTLIFPLLSWSPLQVNEISDLLVLRLCPYFPTLHLIKQFMKQFIIQFIIWFIICFIKIGDERVDIYQQHQFGGSCLSAVKVILGSFTSKNSVEEL